MLFEHHTDPLLPFQKWLRRVFKSIGLTFMFAGTMLGIGILGYHILGKLSWIDSFVEASMILGGMGPVSPLANDAVKIFAACYALLSGLVIIGATGMLLAPWLHRMLHGLYADTAVRKKK